MRYPGGKGGAGVYQTIINNIPPHDTYIETHLGGGNILAFFELPTKAEMLSPADANTPACVDFDGHINGKWVAANAIPGDRSSWGVSEILGERSLAIQHQLAEQAAAASNATGIEKIVGDFWATGMDTARINAQGAGDAADLRPFANVDAGGADGDALVAVDAVAKIARRGLAKAKGGVGKKITGKESRTFKPNIQRVRAVVKGDVRRIKVCTRCMKKGLVRKPVKRAALER